MALDVAEASLRSVNVGKRVFLVAIIAVVFAAAADARLVVQRGIAGVRIDMSQKKVRAILGKPKSVIQGQNAEGPFIEWRYRLLDVDFQNGGPVSSVATSRTKERTVNGVGVGSTQSKVLAKVRGAKCANGLCKVGILKPGKIVTTFYMRKGRVVLISVGRVID